MGIADENNMGIGGTDYGGILTNLLPALQGLKLLLQAGQSSSLQLKYVRSCRSICFAVANRAGCMEKSRNGWIFHTHFKNKTPTLLWQAKKDFNVPSAGSNRCTRRFVRD
jgi:hypothetical protein